MKALFLSTLILSSIYGGNVNSLDTHMDNSTRDKAGLNKLTPQEKQALQEWINTHHSLNSPTPTAKTYQGKGAVLSQNIAGGRYIELADDSLWEINPDDVPTASGWISPVTINVTSNPDSNWPYLLVNSATDSKLRAKSITALPSSISPATAIRVENKSNKFSKGK